MILTQARVAADAAAFISLFLLSDPQIQVIDTPTVQRRLEICNSQSNCVSSNYREPPNRYVSPFRILNEPDVAFQRAVRDLKNNNGGDSATIVEIAPKENYIHLTVPGTSPSSLDDIELIFSPEVVNVKCETRVTLPPPPFCIKKNCINGNMDQRSRVERLGRLLGLPPNDVEEMRGAPNGAHGPIVLTSLRRHQQ